MQKILQRPEIRVVAVALAGALAFSMLLVQPIVARADTSISIVDNSFSPQTITIAPGETVTWTNNGTMQHTVTADDGSYDSGSLNPGASFSHTFTSAGTFPYHCTFHGAAGGVGMSGTIIVESASSATSTSAMTATTTESTTTIPSNITSTSSTSSDMTMNMGSSTTATSTEGGSSNSNQVQITQLENEITALEAQLQALLGISTPLPANVSGDMMTSTLGTAVFADNYSVAPGDTVEFNGQGFGANENIIINANGVVVGSATSDGNGEFTAVSLHAANVTGDTTYWFIGQNSGNRDSVTITVEEPTTMSE